MSAHFSTITIFLFFRKIFNLSIVFSNNFAVFTTETQRDTEREKKRKETGFLQETRFLVNPESLFSVLSIPINGIF
jgi:hypothetical protein